MNTLATLDYILMTHCGGMGKWQVKNSFFVLLVFFASLYPLFITVFTTYAPEHRCYIEQCDLDNQTVLTDWLSFAIPRQESSSNFLAGLKSYDSCTRYERIADGCTENSFNTSKIIQCEHYVYNFYYFDQTLATIHDLVCQDEFKTQLLNSILMLGLLIGSIVGGRLGDKFGRKNTMLIASFILIPVTLGSGFVPSYASYAFLRWVTCVCMPIVWVNNIVYMLETFTPKGRMFVSVTQYCPIYYFIVALIVYLSKDWSFIHIGTAIACCSFIPACFFIPESPRWLAQNNRYDEAYEV